LDNSREVWSRGFLTLAMTSWKSEPDVWREPFAVPADQVYDMFLFAAGIGPANDFSSRR
jgi:hypothetical protein